MWPIYRVFMKRLGSVLPSRAIDLADTLLSDSFERKGKKKPSMIQTLLAPAAVLSSPGNLAASIYVVD